MAEGTVSSSDGLGTRTLDSNEVRRRQKNQTRNSVKFDQKVEDEAANPTIADVVGYSTPTKFTPCYPHNQQPTGTQPPSSSYGESGDPLNPKLSHHSIQFGSHSPKHDGNPSPGRVLQQVFQREAIHMETEDRLTSLVDNLENELKSAKGQVDLDSILARVKNMHQLWGTSNTDHQSSHHTVQKGTIHHPTNNPLPIYSNDNIPIIKLTVPRTPVNWDDPFNPNPPAPKVEKATFTTSHTTSQPSIPSIPDNHLKPKPPPNPKTNSKNWASLFRSQGPSKNMKLEYYPEFRQGKTPIVTLDVAHLDEDNWNHCLVGHFLDGKMDFILANSTAHKQWGKNTPYGLQSVRADKAGFFYFEFKDEESKLAVLEGGPWFFSKRYLVLNNWRRMMSPSKAPPTKIPAWVKLHNLPPECWTEDGLSRVASAIGQPIHVDKATEKKTRLAFARVCVEIEAGTELPDCIQVTVEGDSVDVTVEYQWLPPICADCKVFGHSLNRCTKAAPIKPNPPTEEWQSVGKGKLSSINAGGITALEAVTKFVPISSSINCSSPTPYVSEEDSSEDEDEDMEVIQADKSPMVGAQQKQGTNSIHDQCLGTINPSLEHEEGPPPKPPNIQLLSSVHSIGTEDIKGPSPSSQPSSNKKKKNNNRSISRGSSISKGQ